MSRALLTIAAALASVLFAACFDGDPLVYAPCHSSEACRSAGLIACVVRPELPEEPGFCAPECATPCPEGAEGDASPRCLEIAGEPLCVLECDADTICPNGLVCGDAVDGDGDLRRLCFPEAEVRR